jgi:AcrR family transcriptional regulator
MNSTTTDKPLRADARRNRDKIVEAARAAFAQRGLDAQMDDVAAEAGVGVGTVYRHFPTKDALVRAVIVHKMTGLAADGRRHLESDEGPWEAFRAWLWECGETHVNDRALSQVLSTQPSSAFRQAASEETDLVEVSSELIARAQAVGAVRPDARGDDVGLVMCGLAAVLESGWGDTAWRRYLALVEQGLRAVDGDRLPD